MVLVKVTPSPGDFDRSQKPPLNGTDSLKLDKNEL